MVDRRLNLSIVILRWLYGDNGRQCWQRYSTPTITAVREIRYAIASVRFVIDKSTILTRKDKPFGPVLFFLTVLSIWLCNTPRTKPLTGRKKQKRKQKRTRECSGPFHDITL
jgi:hypothetical protein